ncbi:hypothetical protein J4227_02735 [Candidatus Woesearchaeota archaeon]|nr:hypothetical protein [Candidatus Woesearchaeota archaeon]
MVLLVSLASAANAFAISPGRTTVNFEPGIIKAVKVKVINSEAADVNLVVFVNGPLAKYVTLSAERIQMKKSDREFEFTYTYNLPQSLPPGLNDAEITVREVSGVETGKTTVSALVAVVSQLHVLVPYPGKYVQMEFMVKDQGDKVKFYLPLRNLGTEKIESVASTIIIYAPDGSEVKRIIGSPVSLFSKQNVELQLDWEVETGPGQYRAVAVVEYDGNSTMAEKEFLVGDFFLSPVDISVNSFTLGEIAKFDVLLENIGNSRIDDASARIQFFDLDGRKVADVSSTPYSIEPREKKALPAYWETVGILEGNYAGTLVMRYGSKTSEKQIRVIVEKDAIRAEIIGITALAIAAPESGSSKFSPIYILIGVLVIGNALWAWMYLKKKNAPPGA